MPPGTRRGMTDHAIDEQLTMEVAEHIAGTWDAAVGAALEKQLA